MTAFSDWILNHSQTRTTPEPRAFSFHSHLILPFSHQSIGVEPQVRRGSCLCSSCGRPCCAGCGWLHGSCWSPSFAGPVTSQWFVLVLWVGQPRCWNALAGSCRREDGTYFQEHVGRKQLSRVNLRKPSIDFTPSSAAWLLFEPRLAPSAQPGPARTGPCLQRSEIKGSDKQ